MPDAEGRQINFNLPPDIERTILCKCLEQGINLATVPGRRSGWGKLAYQALLDKFDISYEDPHERIGEERRRLCNDPEVLDEFRFYLGFAMKNKNSARQYIHQVRKFLQDGGEVEDYLKRHPEHKSGVRKFRKFLAK